MMRSRAWLGLPIDRRGFLRVASAPVIQAFGQPASRPNILFLSVDDQNDWVGCLGTYQGVRTPNIDGLAKRGVLFTNAHCASPLCNPSRTAVFTGLRPSTTGVYDNGHWWSPARPDVLTLPRMFRKNGYYVAGAGKNYHHTAGFNPPDQWDEYYPLGFDDPWDRPLAAYPQVESVPRPGRIPLNGLRPAVHELDWGDLGIAERQYADAQLARWASGFLGRRRSQPFVLSLGFFHPHLPWYAPQRFFQMYPKASVRPPAAPADDLNDIPAEGQRIAAARRADLERILAAGKLDEAVQAYLANISFADTLVGQVLTALEQGPYASNTIVMLWSDHGWHLGEKRHWYKSTLWERATRVPLIAAGPGIAKGRRCAAPVSLVDLYPSLVELCSLDHAPRLDGASLAPLLRDPSAARDQPAVTTFLKGNHAVRTGRWRYIRYHDGGEELYDHNNDPDEWTNLAVRPGHAGVKSDLARWLPQSDAEPVPGKGYWNFDYGSYTWTAKPENKRE